MLTNSNSQLDNRRKLNKNISVPFGKFILNRLRARLQSQEGINRSRVLRNKEDLSNTSSNVLINSISK